MEQPDNTNVAVSTTKKVIVLPFSQAVKQVIPYAKEYTLRGNAYLLLRHKIAETKVLRTLGYDVPSPISYQYEWPGHNPFDHQKKTAELLSQNRRAYVMSGLGSGKTRSALFAFDFLKQQGEAHKMLVVAPLSTITATWECEVFKVLPHLQTASLHGTKTQRLKALQQSGADIFIINHDGLYTILDELLDAIKQLPLDTLVIDELATYRNAATRRWKSIKSVASEFKWVWGMSGLPTPNSPSDAWAQVRLITPNAVPKYFGAFKRQVMTQVSQFGWVAKKGAMEEVHRVMQPSVRFATEDCLDLPPTFYTYRDCSLSTEQTKCYTQMLNTYAMESEGQRLLAVNAAVQQSKLIQISAGFAYDSDNGHIQLDDKPRLALLNEILDQAERKVLIFVPFTYLLLRLLKILRLRYNTKPDDDKIVACYGKVPKTRRDVIFSRFQNNDDLQAIVAHPASLSHGITLTAADTIIWYSPTNSFETYKQANARIVRPGQTKHTNIVHIQSGKVETAIYKKLKRNENAQNVLLDMFRNQEFIF